MRLSENYSKALNFAFELHINQIRKCSRTPYFAHLMQVSSLVLEYGGAEKQAIAALLHDAVEDQGGDKTASLIKDKFGDEILSLVLSCSEEASWRELDWKTRKQKYIDKISSQPKEAQLIAICDKIHNLGSIIRDYAQFGSKIWLELKSGAEGNRWFYRNFIDALAPKSNVSATIELERNYRIFLEEVS